MPSGRHRGQGHNWLLTSGIENIMLPFPARRVHRSSDMAVMASGEAFVALVVTVLVLIHGVSDVQTACLLLASATAASHGSYLVYRRVRTA